MHDILFFYKLTMKYSKIIQTYMNNRSANNIITWGPRIAVNYFLLRSRNGCGRQMSFRSLKLLVFQFAVWGSHLYAKNAYILVVYIILVRLIKLPTFSISNHFLVIRCSKIVYKLNILRNKIVEQL